MQSFQNSHFLSTSSLPVLCLTTQSCPTLCDPIDSTVPPGSTVHETLQAVLDWAAILSCKGSFQPRNWTQVSCIAGGFFTVWATRKAQIGWACHEFKFLIISWITEVLFSSVFPTQIFFCIKKYFPFLLGNFQLMFKEKKLFIDEFIHLLSSHCVSGIELLYLN